MDIKRYEYLYYFYVMYKSYLLHLYLFLVLVYIWKRRPVLYNYPGPEWLDGICWSFHPFYIVCFCQKSYVLLHRVLTQGTLLFYWIWTSVKGIVTCPFGLSWAFRVTQPFFHLRCLLSSKSLLMIPPFLTCLFFEVFRRNWETELWSD